MKANGPIPPFFESTRDGQLCIGGKAAGDWMGEGDAPMFAYARPVIEEKIAQFRADMPERLRLHYAVKANPYRPLLDFMASRVDGFDLASRGELSRVEGIDLPLSMAGPGKSDADLHAAILAGVTIHLESEGEADRALAVAEQVGMTPKLAVRVNPPFALKGAGMKMGGLSSQFGVDAERVPALVTSLIERGADWQGYHLYAGSQSLSADAIVESQRESLKLVVEITNATGEMPSEVNLGGGFGIPYFPGDEPLDTKVVGEALENEFNTLSDDFAKTRLMLELGRWLVGEAGVYLTRVIDRNVSHGRTYLVTDGGLQHMLAASGNFGQLLRRNYPVANATRFAAEATEEASVVGRLCTPLDLLADEIMLPKTEVGDVIAIFCAGAYGLTASPNGFLSQPMAGEALTD
ncbi:pyridoxal-dependent decarboxylase, exosortase A system-associated [Sphingomicrobium clamense]|uniref:Pyridoxal-dependent decarboxylase, exosortase A system-associated n=1 Tax=Sphingomicrobium clamense TaxID=2851013 RepID=A0ABS6V7B1_9SPHN|nr:pyridoxal-dependent decarboxylase, exosortase A system-associated [Sphingomicrobium sp. B8]MBW0144953.1 pyridoxal-dependent decarboxylase, exosortase A system-associated [Sphingomicrobium sp. B8]